MSCPAPSRTYKSERGAMAMVAYPQLAFASSSGGVGNYDHVLLMLQLGSYFGPSWLLQANPATCNIWGSLAVTALHPRCGAMWRPWKDPQGP